LPLTAQHLVEPIAPRQPFGHLTPTAQPYLAAERLHVGQVYELLGCQVRAGIQTGLELVDDGEQARDQPLVLGPQQCRPQLEAFAQHPPRQHQATLASKLLDPTGADIQAQGA
jgi:hypothetical protein